MTRGKKPNRRQSNPQPRISPKKQEMYDNTESLMSQLKETGYLQGLLCDYVYEQDRCYWRNLRNGKDKPIKESILRKELYHMVKVYQNKEILKTHLEMRKRMLEERYGV